MDQLVDKIIEIDFEDISIANLPYNESFGLITFINDVKYEFIMNLKENSQKLIISGSGAMSTDRPRDMSRPHLHRWSWCEKIKDSMICFNDPTIYINSQIYGGYGVGTKEDYYLEKIKDISLAIAKNLGLKNENILFYGSSAGGYTSLILSTMVKGSTGLCDIPQFYLNELWGNYWEAFKKYIFIGMDDEEILSKYGYRFSAIEMMKKENYIPNAILILDCSVERDFNMQYLHFLSDLSNLPFGDNKNNIKIYVTGKNKGHVPLNFESSMFAINESDLLGNNLSYNSIFNSHNSISEYEKISLENSSLINKSDIMINLKTQIQSKNTELKVKNEELASKENELKSTSDRLSNLENSFLDSKKEISDTINQLETTKKELANASSQINNKNSEIQAKNNEINNLKTQLKITEVQLESKNTRFNALKNKYDKQSHKLNSNKHSINSYEEKLENSNLEIDYLKKSDKVTKKLLIPIAYAYLIGKSKPSELSTNIKLYKALKSSECFDIGYYLKKYPDIPKSKWCKYFSPELHYVCNGFNEKRKFNKKYYNKKSKKELLNDVKSK